MKDLNKFGKSKIVSILRKQAEKLLDSNNVFFEEDLSGDEVNTLLNELQVFQLELEMQNDELKTSYQSLDTEQAKFKGLFNLAPVGYFILDYVGVIQEANETGVDLLNVSKQAILHKRFQSFISRDSFDNFFRFLRKMQGADGKQTMEIKLELINKQILYTRMEGIAVSSVIARNVKYYVTVIDITESRNAQMALQETKERLEMTLKASSTGTWSADYINNQIYLDDYSYDILEIKPWDFNGNIKSFIALVHPEDRVKVKYELISNVNNSSEIDSEFRMLPKEGMTKHISIKGHGVTDHEGKEYFVGILMDITERKKLAFEAENLKTDQHRVVLSATLTAQEREREKISRTLHDSICQILYGIRLNLQNIQLSNNLKGTFKNIHQLLDQAIRETRQVSYELTPSVLKDFGFTVGIKEMAQRLSTQQFCIKTNIKNTADKLYPNVQVCVFRIIQELINNCIKHSSANIAEIKVFIVEGLVTVIVSDNGNGFYIDDVKEVLKKGSGLRGIKNRIFLLDGNMNLCSTNKGTTVTITFKDNIDLSESF